LDAWMLSNAFKCCHLFDFDCDVDAVWLVKAGKPTHGVSVFLYLHGIVKAAVVAYDVASSPGRISGCL
jgi:hypothetical protein